MLDSTFAHSSSDFVTIPQPSAAFGQPVDNNWKQLLSLGITTNKQCRTAYGRDIDDDLLRQNLVTAEKGPLYSLRPRQSEGPVSEIILIGVETAVCLEL